MKFLTLLLLSICFVLIAADGYSYQEDYGSEEDYNSYSSKYASDLTVDGSLTSLKKVTVGGQYGQPQVVLEDGRITVNGNTLVSGSDGGSGPAGPEGLTGNQGPRGPTGKRGRNGERGPRGATGPAGNVCVTVVKVSSVLTRNGETVQVGKYRKNLLVGDNIRVVVDSVAELERNLLLYVVNVGYFRVVSLNEQGNTLNLFFELRGTSDSGYLKTTQSLCSVAEQGRRGEQGPQGPQGAVGNAGALGEAGPQGNQGPEGETGPQGNQGPEGERGVQGVDGVDGPAGQAGADGLPGLPGQHGLPGPAGPEGPQGNDGPAGPEGPQGNPGKAGPEGPAGALGNEGPAGPEGYSGRPGKQGAPGDQGVEGPKGPQGVEGPLGPKGPFGPVARLAQYTETFNYMLPSVSLITDFTNGFTSTASANLNLFSNVYTKIGANPVSSPKNNRNLLTATVESYTRRCKQGEYLVDGVCNWNLFKYTSSASFCRVSDFLPGPRGCTNCTLRIDQTARKYFDGRSNVNVVQRLTYNNAGVVETLSLGQSCRVLQLYELSDAEVKACGFFCFFHDIETVRVTDDSLTCRYVPPQKLAPLLGVPSLTGLDVTFVGHISTVTLSLTCQSRSVKQAPPAASSPPSYYNGNNNNNNNDYGYGNDDNYGNKNSKNPEAPYLGNPVDATDSYVTEAQGQPGVDRQDYNYGKDDVPVGFGTPDLPTYKK